MATRRERDSRAYKQGQYDAEIEDKPMRAETHGGTYRDLYDLGYSEKRAEMAQMKKEYDEHQNHPLTQLRERLNPLLCHDDPSTAELANIVDDLIIYLQGVE